MRSKGTLTLLILGILFVLTSCVSKQESAVEVTGGVGELNVNEESGSQSFLEIPLTITSTKTVRISNSGKLPLVNLTIREFRKESEINFVKGKAPGDPGKCKQGMLLGVGQSCTFDLIFEPSITGEWFETLEISYNDGVENKTRTIEYHASAGEFALLRTDDDFNSDLGVYEIGTSAVKTIKINNLGGLPAYGLIGYFSGSGPLDFLGNQYPGSGGTCGSSIAANSSCTVVVQFDGSTAGFQTRDLVLDFRNPHSDQSLVLGLGATAAEIKANLNIFKAPAGNIYNFGDTSLGTTVSKRISLYNGGYYPATVSSISIGAPFTISNDTCGATIELRELCTFDLEFTPMLKVSYSLPLTINFHDGKNPGTLMATAVGNGLLPGSMDVYDGPTLVNSYTFPTTGVNGKRSKVLTIKNLGDGPIGDVNLSLVSTQYTYSTTCSSDLGPGSLCYLTINFAPTVSGAAAPANVDLTWIENGTARNKSFPLSADAEGLGMLANKAAPDYYSFGTVYVGTEALHTVTVKNKGIAPATDIVVTTSILAFKDGTQPGTGGTCPATPGFTLGPGDECTLVYSFAPIATGSLSDELFVQYNNSSSVINEKIFDFGGIASDPAILNFNQSSPHSIGTFARNVSHTFSVSIQNNGQGTATLGANNLSNPMFTYNGGSFPGTNPISGSSDCDTVINSGQTCTLHLKFLPTTAGTHNTNISLQYNDGVSNQSIVLTVTGTGADLGYLAAFPEDIIVPNSVVTGTPTTQSFTVNNVGTAAATISSIDPLTGGFSVNSGSSTCITSPVVPGGGSCTVVINFEPTSGGNKTSNFKVTYHDGLSSAFRTSTLKATGLIRALLTNSVNFAPDFGSVILNTTKNFVIRLTNTKTAHASSITVDGLDAPYTLASNGCSTPIGAGEGCNLTIQFRPTALVTYPEPFRVRYFDGISTQEIFFNATGKGENPPSTHGGWTTILAYGSKISVSNNDSNNKRVILSWNNMTPVGGSVITGYNVYRSTVSGTYTTPIGSNISISSRTFTDTTVAMNTTYYYYVAPIINGQDSKVTDSSAHVKVSVPPSNMVLIHRWMANKEVCDRLSRTVEKNNNYVCNFSGRGNKSGKFDIGYDYFVDKYEMGSDRSNRPEQNPIATFNQLQANESCKASGKTLLSRQEWTIASLWSRTYTDAEIEQRESGTYGPTSCNGSGGAFESTGQNSDCESIFGIENAAGNVWEWVSDRVYNGTGVTVDSQRLVPTNKDMDDLYVGELSNSLLEFLPCYSFPLGIPVPQVSGVCPADAFVISSTPSTYFHSDHYFGATDSGARGGLVGGSFGPPAGSTVTSSGVMTHAWISITTAAGGARCGKVAP